MPVETLVLDLLESIIFNTSNIPNIINGIRKAFELKNHSSLEEIEHLNMVIDSKNRKLQNIKTAIMTGFMEDDFKDEISRLQEDIEQLEEERDKLTPAESPPTITEEALRSIINIFSDRVRSRNTEDCKRFIQDFVNSVIVYEDKVEVNLKIPDKSSSFIIRRTVNRQFLPTINKRSKPP